MNRNLMKKAEQWKSLERATLKQREIAEAYYAEELMDLITKEFIKNNKDTGNAVRVEIAVHIFSKTDKTDTHLHKQVINQTSRITVISCKTGKVFYYHAVDFPAHYIGKEPLEIFPVGVRSCVSIVYIFGNTFKFSDMLLIKVIEQITLVDDAVAVAVSYTHL